jgi:hypothetical protein
VINCNYFEETSTMKGFKQPSGDELKVQAIIKRLTPAIIRRDEDAIGRGMQEAKERYGGDLLADAWSQLSEAHPWLVHVALDAMPPAEKHEFYATAYSIMAETIIEAGLRIEDHFRVADEGICLTREAVAAIAATGYPNIAELGEGNADLVGVGIERSPYSHPLSEADPDNPDWINLWGGASLIINFAMGWFPGEPPTDAAMEALKDAVTSAAPNISFEILVTRARYDDRMLAKLVSLAHEGLQGRVDKAFY